MINIFGIQLTYNSIIFFFLLVTFILGIYKSRGIKTFREYVLANKSFNTGMLALSFLATNFGGDILGDAGTIYSDGIIFFVALLGIIPNTLFTAYFIAPKIIYYKNAITSGDILRDLYGENSKIIYGIIGTINRCCGGGMQLIVFGTICKYFLNIDPKLGIIIGGLVLTIYTALGGIKSVTTTDVFHFVFILFIIPFSLIFLVNKFGGVKSVFLEVPKEKFLVFSHKSFYVYLSIFIVWCILPGLDICAPQYAQRILMARTSSQIKYQNIIIAVIDPLFRIVVCMFGILAIIKLPNIQPNDSIPLMINNYLDPKLKLGMILGLIALVMSSADSALHAGSVALVYDALEPILKKFNIKIDTLKFTKYFTFFIGIGSIIIGLKFKNIIDIGYFAAGTLYPLINMPLLFGVMGLKVHKRSFYVAFVCTIITYIISSILLKENDYLIPVFSLIVNTLTFLISNFIYTKGFIILKRDNSEGFYLNKPKEKKLSLKFQNIKSFFINIIPTPSKIFYSSRREMNQSGTYHILFGVYCCINFIFPYFIWKDQNEYLHNLITNLRIFGGILSAFLIVKDQWKESFKKYYHLYWHFVILYCLPFLTTLMFLVSNGTTPWLLNIGVSIFFMILLVSFRTFVITSILGIAFAVIFYNMYVGSIKDISLGFDTNYYLIYQLLFPSIIGVLFAHKKHIFNSIKRNTGINLAKSLCHELRNNLYSLSVNLINLSKLNNIKSKGQIEYQDEKGYLLDTIILDNLIDKTKQAIIFDEKILEIIKTFEQIFNDYEQELRNPSLIYISSIIKHSVIDLGIEKKNKERIKINTINDFLVKIPSLSFKYAIANILRNSFKHGNAKDIIITIGNNKISIRDNGKGISPNDLEKIFEMNYTNGKKGSTGIGLAFAKIVINSFDGEITCQSNQGKNSFTEFTIGFPNLKDLNRSLDSLKQITNKVLKENLLEIAKKMLKLGEEKEKIRKLTKLSLREIESLEYNIQ